MKGMDEENDGNADAGMETNKCQVSSTGKRMNKCEPFFFFSVQLHFEQNSHSSFVKQGEWRIRNGKEIKEEWNRRITKKKGRMSSVTVNRTCCVSHKINGTFIHLLKSKWKSLLLSFSLCFSPSSLKTEFLVSYNRFFFIFPHSISN